MRQQDHHHQEISIVFLIRHALTIAPLLLGGVSSALAESPDPPLNVVFFLVDDLGQQDVACYGSTFYRTPAIDQLARDGMLFTNAYSTCHVCSPSRASILTGKYPARLNLTDWLPGRPERDYETLHSGNRVKALPIDEVTLAQTLQQHGYATANFGKAHLNRSPLTYGFDEEVTGWVRSYYPPYSPQYEKKLPAENDEYFTDRLTTAAIDFIERHRDEPFFVHLEHFAVHDPIQGRKDLVEKYKEARSQLTRDQRPEFTLEANPDGPALSLDDLNNLQEQDTENGHQQNRVWWIKQRQDNPEFAAMVTAMDDSLGRIRRKLKELNLDKRTLIVFTSDNGGMSASNQYRGIGHPQELLDRRFSTSNLPFRGGKGWNYEGGIRVPLIVYWPEQITPGSSSQAVVTGTDFYPTLLQILGLPLLPKQHIDGVSFLSALKAKPHERGPIYWHFPHYSNHGYQSPNGAIRSGRFKLIEYFENGTTQLFDLKEDPGELVDLSTKQPIKRDELLTALHTWRQQVDAQMPMPKTTDQTDSSSSGKAQRMSKAMDKFAPGWTIRQVGGPNMNPGLRTQWKGSDNVLVTHPESREVPCILSTRVEIPKNQSSHLILSVNNHPQGNWNLKVYVNDEEVLDRRVHHGKWEEFKIDLSPYVGTNVKIDLENRANNWSYEAGYWRKIEIVTE